MDLRLAKKGVLCQVLCEAKRPLRVTIIEYAIIPTEKEELLHAWSLAYSLVRYSQFTGALFDPPLNRPRNRAQFRHQLGKLLQSQ